MPRTVVFLTDTPRHPVATFLSEHGYTVFEALDVSEVLHLFEQHDVDALIVGPGVEHYGLDDLRHRRITLNLTVRATAPEVLFELSNLLPSAGERVQ